MLRKSIGESCSPWNRWAPPVYDDPEYHTYLADQGIDGFRFGREIKGVKSDGITPGNSYGGWLEQEDGSPFPMAGTYPHYLVHRALGVLDSLRQQGEDEPLYLHVDLFAPHQPFFLPAGLEEREHELRAQIPLPEGYTSWQANGAQPGEPRIYGTYERNWGLYDAAVAREVAAKQLAMYLVLPNYRNCWLRLGFTEEDLSGQGSDRFLDAMVAWGSEATIRARLQAHFDAGADHVAIQPFDPAGGTSPDWNALAVFAPGD